MKKIVLASSSPRRKELLEKIGLKFEVDASDYSEDLTLEVEPSELAGKISFEKAVAASSKHKNAIIIAADTFGILRGRVLGKPHTESEARRMLKVLSGKTHTVITGFTILDTQTGRSITRSVATRVRFKQLSEKEVANYVKSGEPLDKAGAYAIQGLGSVIVEKIEGDYYNVMGLPLNALSESLKEFGIDIL